MKKCEICLSRIWPWQPSILLEATKTRGHTRCDFVTTRTVETMHKLGFLTMPPPRVFEGESARNILIEFGLIPDDRDKIKTEPRQPDRRTN